MKKKFKKGLKGKKCSEITLNMSLLSYNHRMLRALITFGRNVN